MPNAEVSADVVPVDRPVGARDLNAMRGRQTQVVEMQLYGDARLETELEADKNLDAVASGRGIERIESLERVRDGLLEQDVTTRLHARERRAHMQARRVGDDGKRRLLVAERGMEVRVDLDRTRRLN